jgi:putative Mg2+ transporter-C (MgtC) family protein
MQIDLSWLDVAIRLGLAALAGILIGYNREARSQAAGLRTTTLVCVAACLSMVLANLMLKTELGISDEIMRMDVMRLPLGILTGIGFIGAGAIVRREDVVVGVATAATLWFMTMVGLVIGAGQLVLGVAVTIAGLAMLWALEWADLNIHRRFRAILHICAEPDRFSESELRQVLDADGQRIIAWGVIYRDGGETYEARAELEWRGHTRDRARAPAYLQALATKSGVRQVDWTPEPISA